MNRDQIFYPDRTTLEWWISNLQSSNPLLRVALPNIDTEWYEQIMRTLEMVQMSVYDSDLHRKAAVIFYMINKGHRDVDGNKRSSILVVYLFYLVNNHYIPRSFPIKKLAKSVARSKGRKNYDTWIAKIERAFQNSVRSIS